MPGTEKQGKEGAKDGKETQKGDKKGDGSPQEEELSEEDLELKQNLETCVERIQEGSDPGVRRLALETIRKEIRTATSSMTSVPKPLKFLRPHYDSLKQTFERVSDADNRSSLADVISVLATTYSSENGRETLKYRLLGGKDDLDTWGHEYVRHLAGEIAAEYHERVGSGQGVDDLMALVKKLVPYQVGHNAEPEAVDLLLEVEQLDMLLDHVDDGNYRRTCLYLVSCCHYLPEPEDMAVLKTAHRIYLKMAKHHDALRVALMMNKRECIEEAFMQCTDPLEKKQLCYLLARQGVLVNLEEGKTAVEDEELREQLTAIISNSKLSEHFLALARDLDVMEPKMPDDVYKMHLVEGRQPSTATLDSARQNLSSTLVNAFVNAAFGRDKLVTTPTAAEETHWIFKNKDHCKISATASLGMLLMWDVEGGLPQIDKYFYTSDKYVEAGALLAVGVLNACVQNDCDPAFALLSANVTDADTKVQIGAIMGLGLAYAGTCREDVAELLLPLVSDPDVSVEVCSFAAVSLGMVFVSTAHQECVEAMLQALMLQSSGSLGLDSPFAKHLCLGLSFLFLGRQDVVEPTLEVAKTLNEKISLYCQVLLDTMAYAGSGNVLKVQELLAMCGKHPAEKSASAGAASGSGSGSSSSSSSNNGQQGAAEAPPAWASAHQLPAVLGIALIAMGEELGSHMTLRALEHLLQYCDQPVRRGVPLAIALLHVSNPTMHSMDTLSRLSHDADHTVARNALLALGVLGAGTNNARLAGMLRGLSSYYYKETVELNLVRVAQGLVHMAKGLMTLSPYHTDRQLLSPVALTGLMSVLHACCMDPAETIAGKQYHYMLYYLAAAMNPRMLMTLDEEGKLLPTSVRLGQAVDVVAQAGKPKTISGFQTFNTPVLLGVGERAEMASEKYIPLSPVLEGQVILKPNPDYMEMHE